MNNLSLLVEPLRVELLLNEIIPWFDCFRRDSCAHFIAYFPSTGFQAGCKFMQNE